MLRFSFSIFFSLFFSISLSCVFPETSCRLFVRSICWNLANSQSEFRIGLTGGLVKTTISINTQRFQLLASSINAHVKEINSFNSMKSPRPFNIDIIKGTWSGSSWQSKALGWPFVRVIKVDWFIDSLIDVSRQNTLNCQRRCGQRFTQDFPVPPHFAWTLTHTHTHTSGDTWWVPGSEGKWDLRLVDLRYARSASSFFSFLSHVYFNFNESWGSSLLTGRGRGHVIPHQPRWGKNNSRLVPGWVRIYALPPRLVNVALVISKTLFKSISSPSYQFIKAPPPSCSLKRADIRQ